MKTLSCGLDSLCTRYLTEGLSVCYETPHVCSFLFFFAHLHKPFFSRLSGRDPSYYEVLKAASLMGQTEREKIFPVRCVWRWRAVHLDIYFAVFSRVIYGETMFPSLTSRSSFKISDNWADQRVVLEDHLF
ncbi:hypothetical protein CEXT_714171 [Caerostris extrusa]|uniref:Uncharacterized protein n=1 Tax=Caerostris extrusa TaxID=172846 RepID=A0AAV4N4P9_CAEEX|nr:hypothetical protein CEXT_714171 [Caerostris extrusa]